ncbi:TrmH family RNA methyltransferase [Salegentibacter flavus]|uniref:SpoU rRNA Methylase family protein n=1 Tax=Salegentibacter flavus TaxID=287099 RepID=A0A1I4Z9L8_9FLAO|nr:TrmH family RNA methyltransferase [Salegentibacter flavus]SFN46981.1 SpoU rRNA Methylase family protein [Salegentibacter flavus]
MIQLIHKQNKFEERKFPIVLLLDNITGEANIGSIFRLADAFNVEKIIFTGTPPNLQSNRLKKTARSTHQKVLIEINEDCFLVAETLKSQGYWLYALEITSDSVPIGDFDYQQDRPLCLILGNEVSGIDEKLLKISDKGLHINMYGKNSSMNVAQAAGIALYEITKTILAFNKK